MNTYLENEYRQIFRNLTYPERVSGFEPEVFVRAAKQIGVRVVCIDVRTQCYIHCMKPVFTLRTLFLGTETYIKVAPQESSQKFWSLMTHSVYRVLATRMLGRGRKSHCYTYITPDVPEPETAVEINTVLAAGGIPCIQGCTPYLDHIMARIAEVEPYLENSEEVRCIGLVYSDLTRDAYYRNNDKSFFSQIHGLFRALVEMHLPLQLVGDHQVDKADLKNYKLLILSNVTTLSEQGWDNIRAYVENGGRVLATYKAGLVNRFGQSAGDQLLWSSSGLKYKGEIETELPYWVTKDGLPQNNIPASPNQYLLLNDKQRDEFDLDFSAFLEGGGWAEYEIPGYLKGDLHMPGAALNLATDKSWEIILPLSFRIKPQGKSHETIGLARKKIGKGYVYYLNCDIGQLFSNAGDIILWRKFFKKLVWMATGHLPVEVEAPESVFFSLWRQKGKKRYILHLINDLSTVGRPASRSRMRTTVLPVDAKIILHLGRVRSVKKVIGEASIKIVRKKSGIELLLRGIKERVVLTVE